ncbi:MAG: type I-C CRISPR-associated protein Cas8c/Csd1, partial [Clostridiales bacterium]|nr:type I-C CRISPR-associated protein Cas8c/Csd1 [Candidatus Coliplasma equi]
KRGYYQKLSPYVRSDYEKLIEEIFETLSEFPDEDRNHPLTESYLLGYYLQKKELYTSHKEKENTEV